MEKEELVSAIEKVGECSGKHREVINKVVDFLDESGEVSSMDYYVNCFSQ